MKKLHDNDIREPLFTFFDIKLGKVRFFEEMSIGRSRADIMMVTDDAITGLEIKSDVDSFSRLNKQVIDYNDYFDYNYIVIGKRHLKHAEEYVPESWGVIVCYEEDGKVLIEEIKEAIKNPKRKIDCKLDLLWRSELARISGECLKYKYSNLCKSKLRAKLIEKIDEEQLEQLISRELFSRDYTIYQ